MSATERNPAEGQGLRRWLRVILLAQGGIAILLVAADVSATLYPGLIGDDPLPRGPVSPGDQLRRFEPGDAQPGRSVPLGDPAIDLPAEQPARLEFTVHTDEDFGKILLLNGAIKVGDASRLGTYLDSLGNIPRTVALNSPGGVVDEALSIGRLLRDQKMATAVLRGMACASSCPYVLAAGSTRTVSSSGAVGLHQHYYETPGYMPVYFAVEDIQKGQGRTLEYLIEMGVDPGLMVYSLNTGPSDIYVLVEDELLESRLATEVID